MTTSGGEHGAAQYKRRIGIGITVQGRRAGAVQDFANGRNFATRLH
ncbi:hypothetical protein [Paraburkholderia sp. J41]|nr:hypothetical protein [Paraburkholderia sp. J41]